MSAPTRPNTRRDPYPMTSMEAKALEASAASKASNKKTKQPQQQDQQQDQQQRRQQDQHRQRQPQPQQWSSMPTDTNVDTSKIELTMSEGAESKTSLTTIGSTTTGREGGQEDIYAHTDGPEEDDMEDPVLDVPLHELRGSATDRWLGRTKRWLLKVYHRLYGESLPPSEMIRTLTLAMTLFFMIGGYWLLRSLKDPVLMALCGVKAIPKAKMLSVFVVLGVVSVYNYLLDSAIPKHQLFYVFGSFYFLVFTSIAALLKNDQIGLANKYQSEDRILGWVSYCAIESFGSVMVSLFWSFTNSNITLETAKASYGVMVATAQLGSIMGPAIVQVYSTSWGLANCYLLGSVAMLLLQATMYWYVKQYGTAEERAQQQQQQQQAEEDEEEQADETPQKKKKTKEKAGILEGLYLFWEFNYVKGIFAISCLFMVEVTIVDFTLKMLAKEFFSDEHPCEITDATCYNAATGEFGLTEDATNAIASFMGLFGVATNTLSFIFSLLGTSAIIRHLGLRWTLLLFPSLCLVVIIVVRFHPTLYVVFLAMILLKAISYALNNPTKEMLYQPTSAAVRYKAKSWIDIFGARGSKALGSVVTNAFSDSTDVLVANGSLVGMAVASFLIWNARFMGKTFDEYTASGYIVGEEDDDNPDHPSSNLQMAIQQNDSDDTSCALPQHDEDEDDDEGAAGDDQGGGGEEEAEPKAEDGDEDDDDDEGEKEDQQAFAKKPIGSKEKKKKNQPKTS